MLSRQIAVSTTIIALACAGLASVACPPSQSLSTASARPAPPPASAYLFQAARASITQLSVGINAAAIPPEVAGGVWVPTSFGNWLKESDDVPIHTHVWISEPDEDHRLRLVYRLVNHAETDVVLGQTEGQTSISGGDIQISPRLDEECVVRPGEVWLREMTLQFGVDLPHPVEAECELNTSWFFSHGDYPRLGAYARHNLTFAEVEPSPSRLDQVVAAALRYSREAYPERSFSRYGQVSRADDGWVVRLRGSHVVRGSICSSTIVMDRKGGIKSHRISCGCVRL